MEIKSINYLQLCRPIWGLITSYISLKDEAMLQRSSKEALKFFRSLGKYGPISEEKINHIMYSKKFRYRAIEYKKNWYSRIFQISTNFLEISHETLGSNVDETFPNLKRFIIYSSDFEKLVHSDSKYFSRDPKNKKDDQKKYVFKDKIEIIADKKILYALGPQKLKRLFEIFSQCVKISFVVPLNSSDLEDEIHSCFKAGLVPLIIKDIFSKVVFENKNYDKIDKYKKNHQKIISSFLRKKHKKVISNFQIKNNYDNLFLYQYFCCDVGVTLEEDEYLPLALNLNNPHPLALYANFWISNQKYLKENHTFLYSISLDKELPEFTLINYDQLEKAADQECPMAQYLIFALEHKKHGDLDESRKRILNSYLNAAAKSGYPPAVAFKEFLCKLSEEEVQLSAISNIDVVLGLFDQQILQEGNVLKRKFEEIN